MLDDEVIQSMNSYLSFKLGDEFFAVHVSKVLNILEMVPITRVPKSHESILGVINLRGSVLAVVDIRLKFKLAHTEFTKDTCILVLQVLIGDEYVEVGAVVDSVHSVLEVDENQILPPLSVGVKYKSEYITGIIKNNDRFVMILDIDKLYSLENFTNQAEEILKEA
ncbi:MAG: chemotaxis protein CheW [Bacteroidales bacterium]